MPKSAVGVAAIGAAVALGALGVSYLVDKIQQLDDMASPAGRHKAKVPVSAAHSNSDSADGGSNAAARGASAPAPAPAPGTNGVRAGAGGAAVADGGGAAAGAGGGAAAGGGATGTAGDITPPAPTLRCSRDGRPYREVWLELTDHPDYPVDALVTQYLELQNVPLPDTALAEVIDRDISRTFPKNPMFQRPETTECLRRILQVYAHTDSDVGYVQGMNFLAGFLMQHMADESEAFVMFARLMRHPKYHMRTCFETGLPEVAVTGYQINELLKRHLPSLGRHMTEVGCDPLFFFEMYFTMFTYTLPIDVVPEVWTEFFDQGWVVLFKVLFVLLQHAEPYMAGKDLHGTVTVLKAYHASRLASEFPELETQDPSSPAVPLSSFSDSVSAMLFGASAVAKGAADGIARFVGLPLPTGFGGLLSSRSHAAESHRGEESELFRLDPPAGLMDKAAAFPITARECEELRREALIATQSSSGGRPVASFHVSSPTPSTHSSSEIPASQDSSAPSSSLSPPAALSSVAAPSASGPEAPSPTSDSPVVVDHADAVEDADVPADANVEEDSATLAPAPAPAPAPTPGRARSPVPESFSTVLAEDAQQQP